MNRVLLTVVGIGVCLSVGATADAQYFRVGSFGGVSVRGPFGGVNVGPYGGVSVRTPFGFYGTSGFGYRSFRPPIYYGYGYGYYPPAVSVYSVAPQLRYSRAPLYTVPVAPIYSDPYAYGVAPIVSTQIDIGPRYGATEYVYPVPETEATYPNYQAARPTYDGAIGRAAPEQLKLAAQELKQSLETRRDDADIWLDYLAPQRIIDSIDAGDSPESLSDVLNNYEGVIGNSTLGYIWSTPGFRSTHQLLRSYIENAVSDENGMSRQDEGSSEDDTEVPPEPTPVPIPSPSGEETGPEEILPPDPGPLSDSVSL